MAAADAQFRHWATSVPNFDSSTDGYLPRHTFRGVGLSSPWFLDREQYHYATQSSSMLRIEILQCVTELEDLCSIKCLAIQDS